VEVVAAPVGDWHLAMELPSGIPIRPADANFVSEFFSSREADSPLGYNPFNLAMNESPTLPLGHVAHNYVQVFEPTFVEVIEVAVRPSGVNHRRHKVDEELTIQRFESLLGEAMVRIIHPENPHWATIQLFQMKAGQACPTEQTSSPSRCIPASIPGRFRAARQFDEKDQLLEWNTLDGPAENAQLNFRATG
jgi:hypothetical protein